MQLAAFIQLWIDKVRTQGIGRAEAARQTVADLSDQDAYALLPIVSKLDHQVSMTTCVHRNLPDHARSALQYWLERTDTHELTRLSDADRARTNSLVYRPVVDEPVDEDLVQKYLSGDEWQTYIKARVGGSSVAWTVSQNLEEIARLRHELSVLLGIDSQ